MNAASIRQHNLARLFHALRDRPGASQRDLAAVTGIDKATVSAVIAQLTASGIVARAATSTAEPPARRVGRPEVALRIAADAGVLIGARLEPRTIRVVAASLDGRVIGHRQVVGSLELETALAGLRKAAQALLAGCGEGAALHGVGVGIPALMDAAGRLILAPNLGWRELAILPRLKELFAAPVYVDNDTKAAALAEKLFGSCRTVDDFVYITGHSGVGGGLVLGGRLYRGKGGFAGEIGHMTVVPGGRFCACGSRGCLEAYASESAILARLEERGVALADIWEVAERVEAQDPTVLAVLSETGDVLGRSIANLINLLNPALIVLGGNLAAVAAAILPATRRAVLQSALGPPRAEARLIISPLGAESVPMGGVALALEGFLAGPGLSKAGLEVS